MLCNLLEIAYNRIVGLAGKAGEQKVHRSNVACSIPATLGKALLGSVPPPTTHPLICSLFVSVSTCPLSRPTAIHGYLDVYN